MRQVHLGRNIVQATGILSKNDIVAFGIGWCVIWSVAVCVPSTVNAVHSAARYAPYKTLKMVDQTLG